MIIQKFDAGNMFVSMYIGCCSTWQYTMLIEAFDSHFIVQKARATMYTESLES